MEKQKAKIAFIGLGVMGFPMAGHLLKAGHEVTAWNRTAKKSAEWSKKYNAPAAASIAEAVAGADVVLACVGNDDDLRQVSLTENGALMNMKARAIFIDHTTTSASVAQEVNEKAAELGLGFVDAPVSGGQAGAENASLSIMCGADKKTFDKIKPVLDVYGLRVAHFGKVGNGQLAKMVNQICIAGLVQALSEGIAFAEKAELDIKLLVDTISKGAAGSWQMENRAINMNKRKFDYGFALDLMRKDLNICLNEASKLGASLPITAIVDQFYAQLQEKGRGRCDSSTLIELLDK